MKLIRFKTQDRLLFGVAVGDHAASFHDVMHITGDRFPLLDDIMSYLSGLPESFAQADGLCQTARQKAAGKDFSGMHRLSDVRILPPVPRPAALLDFGLSPKHLMNSTRTMTRYEFGPVKGRIMAAFIIKRIKKNSRSRILMYYKGNPLTVIGDRDEMGWPAYTSYLDIEPELAFVIGGRPGGIAGYLIFNDASARDIQFPEMMGMGPGRAKDFARGNALGPYLVTPDEIEDPLDLSVKVEIGSRYVWHGHTSDYTVRPEQVVEFCETVFPLHPGTVIGMGTVPGCTGLDNDLWINPGELIKMTFDKLGTLHQRVPEKLPALSPSRWRPRPELSGRRS